MEMIHLYTASLTQVQRRRYTGVCVVSTITVRQEGQRQVKRSITHYNLDMIIALGYRVQSQVATYFCRWVTQQLHKYIQKGLTMEES